MLLRKDLADIAEARYPPKEPELLLKMKKRFLLTSLLAAFTVPAIIWAIPQNIGGNGANNIMEEDKWDLPPNYEEWRLDGEGRDGRAPAAADPAPRLFANTKPVEIFGITAPVGAAKLEADHKRWLSVDVSLPARKSDDFHLIHSTLQAEGGSEIAVVGEKPARSMTASVSRFRFDVREQSTGGVNISIDRTDASEKSASR